MRDNNSKKPFFGEGKKDSKPSNSGQRGGFKGKSDGFKSKSEGYQGKSEGYKGKSEGFNKSKDSGFSKSGPGKKSFGKSEDDFSDFSKKPRSISKSGFKNLGEKKFGSKGPFGVKKEQGSDFSEKKDFGGAKKQFFGKKEEAEGPKPYKRDAKPGKSDSSEKSEGLIYKGRGRDQKPVFAAGKPTYKSDKSEKKDSKGFGKKRFVDQDTDIERPDYNFDALPQKKKKMEADESLIRLNKYIANSGICSRREADSLISNGLVTLNGEICTELGRKVKKTDRVVYQGRKINPEKPTYVLLNKPKDFITTTDDPMDRKTVMHLVGNACEERIFPVGRLDRNTTGLLLFTNDGELAAKLSHPSNQIKKIYQVTLDKPLTKKDEEAINEGLTLEDGKVDVDDFQVLSLDRTILGLEIHIGRNRIVRRLFAHLGYDVTALDRVVFAGLDKKDLKRGHYRFLSEQEVIRLKFFI
ncbi:23S rRNA pseudouridine2605 synthase [Algoriphagus ratkowskyi]|uniref:Pseudouridine synthase n=1 Tax=Algoriphagus ratkowskyi TaxID=57028 RepID=A0A2W7R1E9_9BACT|nr:pseudouridine synthase [Algoriphagus ratkowskyi]PZX54663.1 23S rRNA pseudouridine2605 synthase [Algoriphagus ratkowskyi]TXD76975.1 rRNA pseudouridine synthase [Algoriphagus ratkowskyi]